MSSIAKKIRKNMAKSTLKFPVEMYNNIYGSIAICYYALSEQKVSINHIVSRWKEMKRTNKAPALIQEQNFFEKVLNYFGFEYNDYINNSLALVVSDTNMLVTFFDGTNILPLREDGFVGKTLSIGKCYPLKSISMESIKDD